MFRYYATCISYTVLRNIYYFNNITITEVNTNNKTPRPLLLGEMVACIGIGIVISPFLLPFSVVNDMIYIERKQKNMYCDDNIPESIIIASSLCNSKPLFIRKLN